MRMVFCKLCDNEADDLGKVDGENGKEIRLCCRCRAAYKLGRAVEYDDMKRQMDEEMAS